MKGIIAALTLAMSASTALADGPAFFLAEIVTDTVPTVNVIDDYESPRDCMRDALEVRAPNDGFLTCIPMDEPAEEQLAVYIIGFYGMHINDRGEVYE